jgi:hypothetical protein
VQPEDENACRAIAERINRDRPQWLVLYGCYSRQFVAFPLFGMRRRVLVRAGYPDALVARMDEVEHRFRVRPEHDVPDGHRRRRPPSNTGETSGSGGGQEG